MVVFGEKCHDGLIYGERACASEVIPSEVDAGIEVSIPVLGECVVIADGVAEMMGMLKANIFDTKVISNKGENGRVPFVVPETWGCIAMVVLCEC